jgi:signal transduction histidine kinase
MIKIISLDFFIKPATRILNTGLLIYFLLSINFCQAQSDTQAIIKLYDKALDFDDSKIDSLKICITLIENSSKKLGYENGEILSTRLKGINAEFSGDFNAAITCYLHCLDLSRHAGLTKYESSALSDLAYIHMQLKNPSKAKEFYQQSTALSKKNGEAVSIISNLTNLGGICNQLGQTDSALFYLNEAWLIANTLKEKTDLTYLRNNTGNAWFRKKEWAKALQYFHMNAQENILNNDKDQLWYDVLNMADVYIEMTKYDSAKIYLENAMNLAMELGSKRKEADVYSLYSKYYSRIGKYESAYNALQQWNTYDTSLVNEETRQNIAELEQRFHAREREQENKLLVTQFEAEKFRAHNLFLLAIAIAGIALATIFFLFLIRKKNIKLEEKNALIQQQNSKLADLNAEKNSLISIVSHDLGTPFASIRMWSQLLESDPASLNQEQQKAIDRIKSSLDKGESMIRNILNIEKDEINTRAINLEEIDLLQLVKGVIEDHDEKAAKKDIDIHFEHPVKMQLVITDSQLLKRVIDNLLSNAIKFSPPGKNVFIELKKQEQQVFLSVRDEGPGIPEDELKILFSKYGKTSVRPTAGETSTGLGLSIVKRIMQELNGDVNCQSTVGVGSVFAITLKS